MSEAALLPAAVQSASQGNIAQATHGSTAIAACAPALYPGEAGLSSRPLPEQVALVASAWASEMPRLLIFDNCEDEALLDAWLPRGGGCRLVFTFKELLPEAQIHVQHEVGSYVV